MSCKTSFLLSYRPPTRSLLSLIVHAEREGLCQEELAVHLPQLEVHGLHEKFQPTINDLNDETFHIWSFIVRNF